MLQSTPISKVYGHGHIKKFWLIQNQKESENKGLLASSSASPSRLGGSSTGLGHESKQGPQCSLGSTSSKLLLSPSGVPVRPLVSGPACFNMAMARHTSLVTCAESLSPPLRADQSRSLLQPSSPSASASMSREENDDYGSNKSPRRGDDVSVTTLQCGSPFELSNQLDQEAPYRYPFTSKSLFDSRAYDHFSLSNDSRQDSMHQQESFDHVKTSEDVSCESRSLEAYKCSMGIFSNLESSSPFAVPFQLPDKYFSEAEAEAEAETEAKPFDLESVSKLDVRSVLSDRKCAGKSGSRSMPPLLDCGPGKRELSERVCVNSCEASKEEDAHPVVISVLRTCLVCGTSKTPLWRSGPQGPKSLCNACGIRFKKAKRGSGEGPDCSTSPLASPHSMKSLFKPAKRKQDTFPANFEPHSARPLVFGAPAAGLAPQAVKKRRWSKMIKKGECVAQKHEATGSSGESSLTWNLHSPSATSYPSVGQFEKLSIDEKATALGMGAGNDEEEAAVLLMYMSSGLAFA